MQFSNNDVVQGKGMASILVTTKFLIIYDISLNLASQTS
jgi:hypothetical protein